MKIKIALFFLIFLPITQAFCFDRADYSALSLDVYQDASRPPLPEDWSILMRAPANLQTNGFNAIVYRHLNSFDKQTGISDYDFVIAFRGTKFDWFSIWNDFLVAINSTPGGFKSQVIPFIQNVKAFIHSTKLDSYGSRGMTGHSLGAAFAELAGAYYDKDPDINLGPGSPIYSFDSPGTYKMILDAIAAKEVPPTVFNDMVYFLSTEYSGMNMINTCNTQIITREPFAPFTGYKIDHEPFSVQFFLIPDIVYYAFNYTKNQHRMENFYDCDHRKSGLCSYEVVLPVPKSSSDSYTSHYLDYTKRYDYWNAYMDFQWKNNPNLPIKFRGNESEYISAFLYCLANPGETICGLLQQSTDTSSRSSRANNELVTDFERESKLMRQFQENTTGHATELIKIYETASINKRLFYAVMLDDIALAKYLIETRSAEVNYRDGSQSYSLLQFAIMFGHFNMMQFLLQYHANPNLANDLGDTALHTVAMERFQDASDYAKILINNGATPDIKNLAGQTAAMIIAIHYPEGTKAFVHATSK